MTVYERVDMLDVCGPYDMSHWAPNVEVDLVAEPFEVRDGLGAARPADALWVPGAAPESLSRIIHDRDRTFLDFLVAQAAVSRYVCSVCEGALSSGLDEALKLIELLTDTATAESVQQTTQYYPDPRVTSEIPNAIASPMPTA